MIDIFPVMERLAAALFFRDFRILWLGACVSQVGQYAQLVALTWLVLTISQSAMYVGLLAFLAELPVLLFALAGGVTADRFERRYIVMASQSVQLACALTLTALAMLDALSVQYILMIVFLVGIAQAFGRPAYHSLIPVLVSPEHITNATALSAMLFHVGRTVGPLVATVILSVAPPEACFTLNSLTFLMFIGALAMLKVRPSPQRSTSAPLVDVRSGFNYVRSDPCLVGLLVLMFAAAIFGLPLATLLSVIAKDILQQDAGGYSQLMAVSSAGSIFGALLIAWLGTFRHTGLALLGSLAAFGGMTIAFSLSHTVWLSTAFLFACGALFLATLALQTSMLQSITRNEFRGRVLGLNAVAYSGGAAVSFVSSGFAASIVGPQLVLTVAGALLLGTVGALASSPKGIRAL